MKRIEALLFDLFGTVLDLQENLKPFIDTFIQETQIFTNSERFWEIYRHRQRIEQYQDNILMLGHSGYTKVAENAFIYTSNYFGCKPTGKQIKEMMTGWKKLKPFTEVLESLEQLKGRYKLIALSNGEKNYLEYLVKERIKFDFDSIISVEVVGEFKPSPAVYRKASEILEIPVNCLMMVSANSFDVLGAVSSGFWGAYVNRYSLPFENSPHQPHIVCKDFVDLNNQLKSFEGDKKIIK